MTTVAFRIPEEMKKKMDQTDINWSELVRGAIQEALDTELKRHLLRKFRSYPPGKGKVPSGTAVRIIREMRDHG